MPATYEPIATTTLGSAAASITFSSIAGTYTDLRLVFVAKSTNGDNIRIQFNGDTSSSNYSSTWISGNGSTASSSRNTDLSRIQLPSSLDSTQPALVTIDIFSYAGSTNKTVLVEESKDLNGSGVVARQVSCWRNTSAITTIFLESQGGGTFMSGTTATLYGIKNA
jgi:hypothetical protein